MSTAARSFGHGSDPVSRGCVSGASTLTYEQTRLQGRISFVRISNFGLWTVTRFSLKALKMMSSVMDVCVCVSVCLSVCFPFLQELEYLFYFSLYYNLYIILYYNYKVYYEKNKYSCIYLYVYSIHTYTYIHNYIYMSMYERHGFCSERLTNSFQNWIRCCPNSTMQRWHRGVHLTSAVKSTLAGEKCVFFLIVTRFAGMPGQK